MLALFFSFQKFYYFLIPVFIITASAQIYIKQLNRKYTEIISKKNIPAEKIAKEIFKAHGIKKVEILPIEGQRMDHYNIKENTLYLTRHVNQQTHLHAIAIAAYEAGRAVGLHQSNIFLRFRNSLITTARIVSNVAVPLILIGFISFIPVLVRFGSYLFIGVAAFHFITYPVEYQSLKIAKKAIINTESLDEKEKMQVRKIIFSLSLAFIAASLTSIFHLIRQIYLSHKEDSFP